MGFHNRRNELQFFHAEVTRSRNSCRVIMLTGHTGIGKSALTSEVIRQHSGLPAIKVQLFDTHDTVPDGEVIRRMAEAIDGIAGMYDEVESFDSFVISGRSDTMRQKLDRLIEDRVLAETPLKPLVGLRRGFRALSHRAEFRPRTLFRSEEATITHGLADYVRKQLLRVPTTVNIENIQCIDDASFRFLKELIPEVRHGLFILEYTLQPDQSDGLHRILNALTHPHVDIEVRELDKLPFVDYCAMVRCDEALLERFLERYYENTNGNLYEVVSLRHWMTQWDTTQRLAEELERQPGFLTARLVEDLPNNQFSVLAAIRMHRCKVQESLLRVHFTEPSLRVLLIDLESVLQQMVTRELIESDGRNYRIQHDHVVRAIDADPRWAAQSALHDVAWSRLYRGLLDTQDFSLVSKTEALDYLFEFLARADPIKLPALLSEIAEVVVSAFTPSAGARYLDGIRNAMTSGFWRSTSGLTAAWGLLDLYYYLGLYDSAFEMLAWLPSKAQRSIVYRAALLERRHHHREAIELAEQHIRSSETGPGTSFWLCLMIIRMSCYRSLSNSIRSRAVYDEIVRQADIESLPEYPFLLRNTDIVFDLDASIKALERSIMLLSEQGRPDYVAHSWLSLGMQLARIGRLDDAREALREAESIPEYRSFERHILLNNIAVVTIYQGREFEAAVDLLARCMSTATRIFDRTSIHINLIIALEQCGRRDQALVIADRLASLLDTGLLYDKSLIRTGYFTLAWLYGRVAHTVSQDRALELARRTFSRHPKYWNFRLFGKPCTESDDAFRACFSFHCAFLSYWHIPIGCHLGQIE